MPGFFKTDKSVNVIHHLIISVNVEKVFDKIQSLFMLKLLESGHREKLPQHNKGHMWKTHNKHHVPMIVIYNSVLFKVPASRAHTRLELEHIAFHTSNLIIIGSYFRVIEDPSPTQDSFNPYDLHLDSTLAIHVYSSIINRKFYNFELKCPTSWSQTYFFQLFPET